MNRDHRGVCLVDNLHHAAFERQQLSGSRDTTLCEDADQIAINNRLPRVFQRLHQCSRTVARADGDDAEDVCQPLNRLQVVGVGHHADRSGTRQHDQRTVDPRYVVGNNKGSAFIRHVVDTFDLHAVDELADQPD